MRPGIEEKFIEFISGGNVEGRLNKMYLDNAKPTGKVTTGIGYLIDSPGAARALQWLRDGSNELASNEEVVRVWNYIKSRQDMKEGGGVAYTRLPENNIHLSNEEVDRTTRARLSSFIDTVRQQIPGIDAFPADAQFAIMHMIWAKGPGFQDFPKFKAFLNQLIPDFEGAATESHIRGLSEKRNEQIVAGLKNAAEVLRRNADPDQLYWPNPVAVGVAAGSSLVGLSLLTISGYALWKWLKGSGKL